VLKHVRIDGYGKVVDADRTTHVTKVPAHDGPDSVQWLRVPGVTATFTVHFASSPFRSGPQDFEVPGPPSGGASQAVGTYKYSVYDAKGVQTDDPDIDIES
jgi:hypothetical protein